jgi:cytochrome c oxidase cbb3-type subunit IV
MYKEVLSGIKDISIYPVFSVLVFFVFFSIIIFWVLKSKKSDFDEVSNIPLANNNDKVI